METQEVAQRVLKRELNGNEINSIRNAGSLMMLEAVFMKVKAAKSQEDILSAFQDISNASQGRLEESIATVARSASLKFKQQVSVDELTKVVKIDNCLEGMELLHRIEDAESTESFLEVLESFRVLGKLPE